MLIFKFDDGSKIEIDSYSEYYNFREKLGLDNTVLETTHILYDLLLELSDNNITEFFCKEEIIKTHPYRNQLFEIAEITGY